jgi:phosphoribosylformylglycinamidine cyclo-ligase
MCNCVSAFRNFTSIDYKAAGVDREKGEDVKKRIGELARRTFNENVLREIGLFGGFFRFAPENYREPVLVASVDGIGTKIKLAFWNWLKACRTPAKMPVAR